MDLLSILFLGVIVYGIKWLVDINDKRTPNEILKDEQAKNQNSKSEETNDERIREMENDAHHWLEDDDE